MGDLLSDTETWGLAVGALSPLLIAIVQQPRWSPRVRVMVAWVCAVMLGLATCLARGDLADAPTVVRTCLLVLLSAQAVLTGWKRLGIVPAIETRTAIPATSARRRHPPVGP
jgi:hypothetical protein